MMCPPTSTPDNRLAQPQYRIGSRVRIGTQHGSVIDVDPDRGWLEVDFDGVGQQWIDIAYAQPVTDHR